MTTERGEFTPGPWAWEWLTESPTRTVGLLSGNERSIALHDAGWAIAEADARLIVAAPDLLAALRVCKTELEALEGRTIDELGSELPISLNVMFDSVQSAITKALGAKS